MSRFSSNQIVLDAVTVDTTSGAQDVSMRTKLSLQFIAASITSGNGIFTVDVSNDGTHWTAYNRLTTNATNTNVQTDVRVASVTLSSNTSVFVFFPVGDYFRYLRVSVDATTDGVYSAILQSID